MEQCPYSAADSSSASQEIPQPLWKLKFHNRVHKRQLLNCRNSRTVYNAVYL